MSEADDRDRVVAVARTWIGTPFHHVAGIKHVGVDCAHFLARVFEEAGLIEPIEIENYSPQWFLNRYEEKFISYVLKCGGVEISEQEAQRGDVVLYRLGHCFAHGGIIVDWPREIIHAHMLSRGVLTAGGHEGGLLGRETRFFTLFKSKGGAE